MHEGDGEKEGSGHKIGRAKRQVKLEYEVFEAVHECS